MIVQCDHCLTKYRISDEKVKGKGVKVRCAKCDNVFTVTPPDRDPQAAMAAATSPPAPEPPMPGSSVPGPTGPEPPAAPPREETAPDHGGGFTGEEPGPSPPPPADGSQAPPLPEGGQHAPSDQKAGGYEPPSFGEEGLDFGAQRPAHEMDKTGLASTPLSPSEKPEDGGMEIEGTMREGPFPGSDPLGGQTGEGTAALPQDPDAQWGNIAINGQALPDAENSAFGLADSSGREPPPSVPMEEHLEQDLPDYLEDTVTGTGTVPSYKTETRASSGGKKGLVLLLLLAALGGGGYIAYPTVMEIIQSRGQQAEGTLTPANIQVKALNRTDGKILYSVRGEVRNESAGNVGMIKVEAQFRSASDEVLAKASSYCGNLFEDRELVSLDLKRVRSDLQNELGQSLSNATVLPGQAVPFLVILENPPSGISKVTVTISSFKETT